jgi:hypothetical protein
VQPGGEREVAEVVRGELHLPPLRRPHQRRGHDPGVVDQDVQGAVPRRDELCNRCQVGKVEGRDEHPAVAGALGDVGGDLLTRRGVTDGQGDFGVRASERTGRLDADTGGTTGDDRAATGEVDSGDHLGGGRLGGEWSGDAISHRASRLVDSNRRVLRSL